jgi:hypothetical protein
MRSPPGALSLGLFSLTALVLLGDANPSNAMEPITLSPSERQAVIHSAKRWLRLVDAGKYNESFAAASDLFRENLTAEEWEADQASTRRQLGAVITRDQNIDLQAFAAKDGKGTIICTLWITTTFQKMAAGERLRMVKESGEWKVAHYTVSSRAGPDDPSLIVSETKAALWLEQPLAQLIQSRTTAEQHGFVEFASQDFKDLPRALLAGNT